MVGRKIRWSPFASIPLFFFQANAHGLGADDSQGPVDYRKVQEALDLGSFGLGELVSLDLREDGSVNAVFLAAGRRLDLALKRKNLRSPDFQLLVQGGDGDLRSEEPGAPRTLRGTIENIEGSAVAASLAPGGGFAGLVLRLGPGEADFLFAQPVRELDPAAKPSDYILFAGRDVLPKGSCGGAIAPPSVSPGSPDPTGGGGSAGASGPTGNKIADLAIDADVEFFNLNGGSVANTLFDIENVLNNVEFTYERDTQITYELTTLLVRTAEPDPYSSTDPGTLLNQFRSHWNTTLGAIRRDAAHLMTGKNLSGSVIGIAFVGVVCLRSSAYGVSQSRFSSNSNSRLALTAHELGHNWNAPHCDGNGDCHIMCSGLGGCNGLGNPPRYGVPSINTIVSFKNSRNCLLAEEGALPVPFFDEFAAAAIDPVKWSYVQGAAADANAENEPSPPNAANLDALGANPGQEDDLRSNFLRLSGKSGLGLSYFVERKGVEAGEQLSVEYRNSSLKWLPLNALVSDGADQSAFQFFRHPLPPDAYHDEFRVRFRTMGNEPNDDWWVDDVHVTDGPTLTQDVLVRGQTATLRAFGANAGETVFFLYSLSGLGSGPCFFNGAICLDLLPPFFILGSAAADGSGLASLPVFIPSGTPLINVQTQAGIVRGVSGELSVKSNALDRAIL